MFRQLSKITLKYTSSFFTHYYQGHITPKLVETWLKDLQIGLDALLDDQIMLAEDAFSTSDKSPFHEFGYALIIYVKAMLSMDRCQIDQAIDCISNLEILIKRILSTTRKKTKPSLHASFSAPQIDIYKMNDKQDAMELQFELLYANCILMSATLQFLKDSWIDHLKAAYDLRKAYKIFERLFETITGMSLLDYETKSDKPKPRRTVSCDDGLNSQDCFPDLFDETIQHGAYFGIGLFNVIFSVLPIKVKKILSSLGFHSSRSIAISLLQKAYRSLTMYSSLSALVLLTFYANISVYIQPAMNEFFHHNDAHEILDRMKLYYPHGHLWNLLQGKLNQGSKNSILLFEKAKNANHHKKKESHIENYFRNASITEFTQFRSFTMYELGWSYVYAGNYSQAAETFFCLESMCNWSRLFYHYIATCCMIANRSYDKSELEIRQMVLMLDNKKLSCNDQFAESRIKMWIEISVVNAKPLKETLQKDIINPIWELVYLWNGISCFSAHIINEIRSQQYDDGEDPLLFLLRGVIERDIDGHVELALDYFNKAFITHTKKHWIPYAMYEIAATHFVILKRDRSHTTEHQSTILDWIKCIENYYQSTLDAEWDARMQLKCQLLTESCHSI